MTQHELKQPERAQVFKTLQAMPYNEWHDHTEWTQKQWAFIITVCQTQKRGELETNGTDSDHGTITMIRKIKRPY